MPAFSTTKGYGGKTQIGSDKLRLKCPSQETAGARLAAEVGSERMQQRGEPSITGSVGDLPSPPPPLVAHS